MQIVQITAANPSKTFKIDGDSDKDNLVRFGTKLTGNNFAGQTVAMHVENPAAAGEWYDTGVSFTTNFAAVVQMKKGHNYRLIAPTAAGLDVSVMFY